jgi:hypothetical protein
MLLQPATATRQVRLILVATAERHWLAADAFFWGENPPARVTLAKLAGEAEIL